MRIFLTWFEFWKSIWDSIQIAWSNLGKYWLQGDESNGPFLVNFLFALFVLVFGWVLIKIIMKIIRKVAKVQKGIVKDKTAKSFLVSTIGILLYFGLVILVLVILRVDLRSASQIFASAILAIGLSLQNVVSNFASGIIILSNKPFVVGEYVSINGEAEGTVVAVKFLSTTLLTVNEQVITIQNSSVTSGRVVNFSRSPIRRIVLDVKVDYSADIDLVKKVLRQAASEDCRVLVGNEISTVVTEFENNSVTVSLRCFVPNIEYWDARFDIFERVAFLLKENKVRVALNQVVVTKRDDYNDGGLY